jgi:hypothetical protein
MALSGSRRPYLLQGLRALEETFGHTKAASAPPAEAALSNHHPRERDAKTCYFRCISWMYLVGSWRALIPGLRPTHLPCRVDSPMGRSTVKRSRINPFSTLKTTTPMRRWAPSSMPTGGAAAVLSWLSERLDVSQSRVPAVPQQCRAPEGSRRPYDVASFRSGDLWPSKDPFPSAARKRHSNHHPREADTKPQPAHRSIKPHEVVNYHRIL